MSIFDGFRHAYGTYSAQMAPQEGGPKLKGKAISVPRDLTSHNWELHVAGKIGLGVIPINERSEVKFAAIDIDSYEGVLPSVNQRIQELKLPLVACRTKSGGCHAYLFLKDFVDAGIVQKRMREFAAYLGYGNAEIFPKQTRIVPERGDIGQWINMPYFNAAATDRYALAPDGSKLGIDEFIIFANSKSLSVDELLAVKIGTTEALPDGPPCLNHLVSMGFPEGTRNNGLFNLTVYAKKAYPDSWEKYVEEYNNKFMNPPLATSEVLGILKSARKEKDFFYTCKQAPLCNYCNMPQCRKAKHGIGLGGTGLPKFGTLTKLLTEPVIWFLEIENGGRLELSTEDLQNQRRFQNRCMESLNVMPSMIKAEDWQAIIQGLLEQVTVVEMPVELTSSGILKRHLEDFCTSRAQAQNKEEILTGKPWTDNGYHFFRMSDFMDYLERRKFRELNLSEIGMWFREWKAEKKFMNLKGKGCTLTVVPEFKGQQVEKFDVTVDTTPPPFV